MRALVCRCLHSPCVLGKWHHLPFLTGLCITSVLTSSSFPSVEGLKDLLVGPGVELLLTPREPALPMEAESGGNTSPGITASECQGRRPRWWVGGIEENGVVPGTKCCQGPGEVSSAQPFLLQQMVRPEPSMARLSSAEPTQTPARRWVLRRCQDLARGWERDSWPIDS